ncbi:dolichol-phosphate mannosyltransferase [Strigomonas culicis]|uniref:Dolichol-phosphate mannosyltransferase subunit 1 n=1 Tax=Strigomonas culicis TaxID=28005 RepID=S9VXY8_9TRYP|nr:dolichol-phosphate mannosyltransferase [Strigomonas culicis]|eukprot:EPY31926.1 dolichol-phosphate mannosyltransferase [Strigomonas culicis]
MSIEFSIIVPTYKECGNIKPLTERVFAALEKSKLKDKTELLFVDDNSRDGSVEAVQALKGAGYRVDMAVRTTDRGLSSAVIHGLRNAKGRYLLVMDADLQHPPEAVPRLLEALQKKGVEFVCGTRYGEGVEMDKNWPLHRRVISWGARMLARPLSSLSDPMSGFFGLRQNVFERGLKHINPIGYKIALELFVKCDIHKFEEVGFNFATRTYGESKLTGAVIVNYLQHLRTLYYYKMGVAFYILLVAILLTALEVLITIYAVIS